MTNERIGKMNLQLLESWVKIGTTVGFMNSGYGYFDIRY